MLHIWKTQQWPQNWKSSVFIPIPKKGHAKECSNCHKVVLFSHASKVMFKILQAGLQQYMNWELPDTKAGFIKGRRTRDQIANIHWIIVKARELQKNIYFCFTDYAKAFVWIITNWKILKGWEYQTTLPASWETCMQIKKQQLEPNMEQWAGSKLRKEYVKALYCHTVYLFNYMQCTSYEIPGWMKHKLESRLPEEISTTSDSQIIPP